MSPITTHILDNSLGTPAAGVAVTLFRISEEGQSTEIGDGVTNEDGRVADLLEPGQALPGVYRLRFEVSDYFNKQNRETFYPHVEITFRVADTEAHYHVPLLLSPYGYTTYRGS